MEITVNGEARQVPAGTSVEALLAALRVERRACAVEVNRELVPWSLHAARALEAGDAVEIVTLVGGG